MDAKDWSNYANSYISEFLYLSRIQELFGNLVHMSSRIPAGYTFGLTVDGVPWYFAIALHEHFQEMGVCIRFSAEAWAWYQKRFAEQYLENMDAASFLQMIQSPRYIARVSRVDLTADYFNYGWSLMPDFIHKTLIDKSVQVVDHNGRAARRKITAYESNGIVETIVIGSKKENTKSLCRIYDKKAEQISKDGFRLEEALNCETWTRFEVSYRGSYAHQIGDGLVKIKSGAELSRFIAARMADKYRFLLITDEVYTDYTNALIEIAANDASALRSEDPKNNSLRQSIAYLIKGSGLFPTIYKVGAIWGKDAEIELLQQLYAIYNSEYVSDAERDHKIQRWLEQNKNSLRRQRLAEIFMCGGQKRE